MFGWIDRFFMVTPCKQESTLVIEIGGVFESRNPAVDVSGLILRDKLAPQLPIYLFVSFARILPLLLFPHLHTDLVRNVTNYLAHFSPNLALSLLYIKAQSGMLPFLYFRPNPDLSNAPKDGFQ